MNPRGWTVGTTMFVGWLLALLSARAHAARGPEVSTIEPDFGAGSSVPGIVVEARGPQADASTTRVWVEDRAAQVLGIADIPPIESGSQIQIVVRGVAYDYRVSLTLSRGGQVLAPEQQPAEILCECGSDEMLERVGAAIQDGSRALAAVAEAERAAEFRAAELRAATRNRGRAMREERRQQREALAEKRYQPSAQGFAGIGLGALGLGSLAAGIPLIFRSDAVRVDSGRPDEPSTRPVGIVMTVVGSAVLAAGVALLARDVVEFRQRKLALGLFVTPGVAGVSMSGRF